MVIKHPAKAQAAAGTSLTYVVNATAYATKL